MAKERIQPNAKKDQPTESTGSREMIQRRIEESSQRYGASRPDASATAQRIVQTPNSFRAE